MCSLHKVGGTPRQGRSGVMPADRLRLRALGARRFPPELQSVPDDLNDNSGEAA